MSKVIVKTSARLALCLIDMNGERGRVDGCVGFSIKDPHIEILVEFSKDSNTSEIDTHDISDSEKKDLIALVEKVKSNHSITNGIKIKIISIYNQHNGLGSGTQLKLSIAAAINVFAKKKFTNIDLATEVKRGGTSGIGVWSFQKGGFIVDGGHSFGNEKEKQSFLPSNKSDNKPPPLVFHSNFPDDWKILCFSPVTDYKLYGISEYNLFKDNCPVAKSEVDSLTWIILMKLLPSIVQVDLKEFNYSIDEMQNLGFKKTVWNYQPQIVKMIKDMIISEGINGLGLSSLGSTLFTVVHKNEIDFLQKSINDTFSKKNINCRIWSTSGNNEGAKVTIVS